MPLTVLMYWLPILSLNFRTCTSIVRVFEASIPSQMRLAISSLVYTFPGLLFSNSINSNSFLDKLSKIFYLNIFERFCQLKGIGI